jgi:hypothetical protein
MIDIIWAFFFSVLAIAGGAALIWKMEPSGYENLARLFREHKSRFQEKDFTP